MHTRMRRASSDARLVAAVEGRAVTAGGHGTAAGRIVERVPHGELVQTRISKCGGSSDDMVLTSPLAARGWLSNGACIHPSLLCRVPSHRSSGLLVPQCQGSKIRCTRWMCPIGWVHAWRVAHARHSRVSPPSRRIPDYLPPH